MEGWKFLRKNDLCEVWWKDEEDKPVHLIKVRGQSSFIICVLSVFAELYVLVLCWIAIYRMLKIQIITAKNECFV